MCKLCEVIADMYKLPQQLDMVMWNSVFYKGVKTFEDHEPQQVFYIQYKNGIVYYFP